MTAKSVVLTEAVLNPTVRHTVKSGVVTTVFSLSATINQESAEKLGVKSLLYGPRGISKDQFQTISLCPIEEQLRVYLTAQDIPEVMQAVSDRCDMIVTAPGNGLSITTKFTMTGNPYAVVEFLLKAGDAPCRLTIEKSQESLDLEAGDKVVGDTPASESATEDEDTERESPESVLVHFRTVSA